MSERATALRLGVIGLLTVAAQTALLRELTVALHGGELVLAVGMGLWLLGSGAGAMRWRRRSPRAATAADAGRRDPAWPGYLMLALLPALSLILLRESPRLAGATPGAYLPVPRMLLVALAALAPISLLLGRLFCIAARDWRRRGRGLAHAYGVECAGAAVGGVLATAVLRLGWRNIDLVMICGLAAALAVLPAQITGRGGRLRRPAAMAALLLMLLGLALGGPLDAALTARQHPGLMTVADTPYGRTTVTEAEGRAAVFRDGVLDFETEGADAEAFAHLALLHHARPETVLILGGAAAGVPAEALAHGPDLVDVVVLDIEALELARPHLPPRTAAALDDPRVKLIAADPRRFLSRAESPTYDAILVAMPPPETVAANRFYTREFAELCHDRLDPDGLLALRLPPDANLWTPPRLKLAGAVDAALREIFPRVALLPGEPSLAVASRSSAAAGTELLSARLEKRDLKPRLVSAPWLEYRLANDRVTRLREELARLRAEPNTDMRPACTLFAITLWCARFHPALAFFDGMETGFGGLLPRWSAWLIPILPALAFWMVRRRPRPRRIGLAALAGFSGMALETALLLRYQVTDSVLYQDLGLLLTLFMAGMTTGALYCGRKAATAPAADRRDPSTTLLLGGGAAGAVLLFLWMESSRGGLPETGAWLLGAGFWTAALFAAAANPPAGDPDPVVGPVYAADLAGGCAGAWLGGLMLVPLLGLPAAALAVAVLAAAALPAR